MATILRSSKYVRNFAEFATKLGYSQIKRDNCVGLISHGRSLSSALAKSLTTQAAPKTEQNESKLEIKLQRLDADVKRSGRISRTRLQQILNTFQNSESVTSTQALMIIRCCGNLVPDELPEARSKLVNQVWQSLENAGVQLDLSHYNALLRVYIENEYAFSPTEILAELERKGIEPNKLTYQRLISRYCQQGDIDGATKILEFMREKGISINEAIFTALVRGHSEAGDMVSAADILTVMRQAGLEPTPDTYKELLCGYAKHGDIESINQTLSDCKTRNVHLLDTDFLPVIFSLANNGHEDHVPAILSVMPKEVGYAPDALNYILKLVHIQKLDTALQVLDSIPSRAKGMTGGPVIKQLARANLPVSQLLAFCREIEFKGINSVALSIVLESYLAQGNIEGSLAALQALKESGSEIREHYFWPIFTALGRSKDNAGIDNLLRTMRSDYAVNVSSDTIRDYVIPNKTGELDQVMTELRVAAIPPGIIASAIMYHLINQMKLKEAVDFAAQHVFRYNAALFSKPLATALAHTKDVASFVKILRDIYDHEVEFHERQAAADEKRILEPYIVEVATSIKDEKSELLIEVLKELAAAGLHMSALSLSTLKRTLGRQITPELTKLINELQSDNFTSRQGTRFNPEITRAEIARLEPLLKTANADDESIVTIKKRLLYHYCRIRDMENIEKLLNELESINAEFVPSLYRQLMDAYLDSEVLDKSEKFMNALLRLEPDFVLNEGKFLKYCILLIKNDRLDDALNFMKTQKDNLLKYSTKSSNLCWRLLTAVADLGLPKAVNAIFDELLKNECITISGPYLGPLIKVHLVKGELREAMNEFERICETYQHTPFKNELAKKLIEAEDATALQRLTDLSTQVHGETNSLYDLAASFIECNCIRQAKKILEIPALHSRHNKLKITAERYCELSQTVHLERLVETIKDLPPYKTMPEFYNNLLQCYVKENNWEKALNLYNQMVEEEVDLSNVFVVNLNSLLKKNNQPVPFLVPDTNESQIWGETTKKSVASQLVPEAEDERRSKKSLAVNYAEKETELIDSLLENNELDSAVEITESLLAKNVFPMNRTFRSLIRKLALSGNTESLEKMSDKLPWAIKRKVLFDHNLCEAYVAAGKPEEYLDWLDKYLEKISPSGSDNNSENFPISGVNNLLQKNPTSVERYTKLAEKYATQGFLVPMNSLWMYYFLRGEPEADKIWSEHLVNSPTVTVRSVVHTAQKLSDAELVLRLIETIKTAPNVDNDSKGFAYSVLMEINFLSGKYQESIDVLRDSLKVLPLKHLRRDILRHMKSCLAQNGLAIPSDILPESQPIAEREKVTV